MKNLWKIVYYETSTGECPVEEFINSKNPRNQAKLLAFISLLEERGPNLPRPYADLLEDGIHELRVKLSGHQIRVFYFFLLPGHDCVDSCVYKNYSKSSSIRNKNCSKVSRRFSQTILSRARLGDVQ